MKLARKILAFNIYPRPKGGELYESDLDTEVKVLKLFDYCQILQSSIYPEGWKFLFDRYGIIKLYQIDKESGWFDTEDKKEWMESVLYHSLISGFNPQSGSFGEYNEENGEFVNSNNESEKIDWEKFMSKASILENEE